MGKQLDGEFLRWPLNGEAASHVQGKAVEQLLVLWREGMRKTGKPPLWGDEVEFAIVRVDDSTQQASLAMRQKKVLKQLSKAQSSRDEVHRKNGILHDLSEGQNADYTAEFANYMVEAMPGQPYGESIADLLRVEEDMYQRRQAISRQLSTKEYPYTLSIFPRLGTPDALNGVLKRKMENSNVNDSTSVPDGVVSTESRYQAAEKNIPARREDQQRIKVHKYQDKNTDGMPVLLEGTIFGPGHCGLQATFQASDEIEARLLHDQFIPLGPIMLALTASTPIYGGYLTDTDARWNQISQAVDDRLDHEVDQMTNGASVDLPQRWFCNTTYLSNDPRLKEEYQLKNLATNDEAYKKLTEAGLDPLISRHFAHIFVRDPIMISESDANSHDPVAKHHTNVDLNTNHFESLNGTVWPHVRLKIPPHDDSNIGWRVEFRAMETQLTDFENGAFCIFMALVRRVITAYDLNFYMPLEKVQENMDLAHERDAVTTQKFEFRSEVIPSSDDGVDREEFERLSVDEIINGGARFKGLLPFIYRFLGEQDVDEKVSRALKPYLDLVSSRASGRLWTAARWMREYVRSHEEYREDSYVNPQVCYDMMKRIRGLIEGDRRGCGMFQQTP